jgi:hypothetical protein
MSKKFKTEKTKGLLIQIPEGASNFQISAEYRPYSVWLEMKGRIFPMPIGNMIYPYRHDELRIAGTSDEVNREEYQIPADGRWLVLEAVYDDDRFKKLGTPTTIGELKKIISEYDDHVSFGFRNQPIQSLFEIRVGETVFVVFQ